MKKFKVVYAMSYTVDAEDENQATEMANELFEEDALKSIQEAGSVIDMMGVNVEEED